MVITVFVRLKAKQKHIPLNQFDTNKSAISWGSIWSGAKGAFCFGEPYQINSTKGGFLEWRTGVNLVRFIHSQFCFHLRQQLIAKKPGMRLEHPAGDKLFIDFAGKPMHYIDRSTGELIGCQIFVASLPFSDYCFAMAVRSQRVDDFLHALECCLRELGGAPAVLVPDNLKSAVIKADRFEPEINRALEDFANHYDITVIPTRPAKPKDKALVENQVKLVYNRVYARLRNRQFFDLESLNQAISEKVKAHNQTRMQQKQCSIDKLYCSKFVDLKIDSLLMLFSGMI
jgi:hypothetical protein